MTQTNHTKHGEMTVSHDFADMQNNAGFDFNTLSGGESIDASEYSSEPDNFTLTIDPKKALEGSVKKYENPTDPVAEHDWEAAR